MKICAPLYHVNNFILTPVKMMEFVLNWQICLLFVTFRSVVNMSNTQLKGYGSVAVVNSKIRKMKGKQTLNMANPSEYL